MVQPDYANERDQFAPFNSTIAFDDPNP